jgi:hypothetical protein
MPLNWEEEEKEAERKPAGLLEKETKEVKQ